MARHLLTGRELDPETLQALLERALELKAAPRSSDALSRRSVALIFHNPSTRTRLSMAAGVTELGGSPMLLRSDELQLSRGESVRDTAYILSRHTSAIGIRTKEDALVEELAEHASIPVINLLTHLHHPCQALADLLTLREEFGRTAGLKLAYVGDGNNVARSLAVLGEIAGVEVRVASPPQLSLEPIASAVLTGDPHEAATGADALYTDVWVSMNDPDGVAAERRRLLADYQLNQELVNVAAPAAIVLHCLPAHPGEEITEDLLYGERQRIWQQAENRRHVQKALLEYLVAA